MADDWDEPFEHVKGDFIEFAELASHVDNNFTTFDIAYISTTISLIFGISAALAIYAYIRLIWKKRAPNWQVLRNEQILQLCQNEPCYSVGTLCHTLNSWNDAKIGLFRQEIGSLDEEVKRLFKDQLIFRENCRLPCLPLLKDGAEQTELHCSILRDFYGSPVYLTMAPTFGEFSHFWKTVIDSMVGVVVWVGNVKDNQTGRVRIDPFIPNILNWIEVYDTVWIQTVKIQKFSDWCTEYTVKIIHPRKAEVKLIHCYDLPTKSHPSGSTSSTGLAISLARVEEAHRMAIGSHGRHGVLFHGCSGLNSTAMAVAVYICRQMLLATGVVCPTAICNYLRQRRFGVFVLTPFRGEIFKLIFELILSGIPGVHKAGKTGFMFSGKPPASTSTASSNLFTAGGPSKKSSQSLPKTKTPSTGGLHSYTLTHSTPV